VREITDKALSAFGKYCLRCHSDGICRAALLRCPLRVHKRECQRAAPCSSLTAQGTGGVLSLQALGRDRVRSCRRAFFRSVASFIFSLKTRISEYSFWISGRVRSASSCWAVSFNNAAICVLWMWCMAIKSAVGKTERHDTANFGAASLEINSQPYCRFFCSASLPSSGRGLPSTHNEFLDRMNRASKLSRPATTRRRD
jgi:hypothetical protein